MSKTIQRIILIMAILISGGTYVLMRWVSPELKPPALVQPVGLAMQLSIQDSETDKVMSLPSFYSLMVVVENADAPLLDQVDLVMGGLLQHQNIIRAVALVLDRQDASEDWHRRYEAQHPNILLIDAPKSQQAGLLRTLRQCPSRGECAKMVHSNRRVIQPWMYLLKSDEQESPFALYIGDARWGGVAIVEDLAKLLSVYSGK